MKKEKKQPNAKNFFRFKFLFLLFVFMLTAYYLLPTTSALAHNDQNAFWTPGEPIVPCGLSQDSPATPWDDERIPCDKCQLLHLLRHIIDLVLIFVAPVIGTLFFIVAGVMIMLGGDNPGMLSRGKSIFKSTFIGVAIIFMSWLITNTLIQTFAATTITFPNGSTWNSSNWWTFSCSML